MSGAIAVIKLHCSKKGADSEHQTEPRGVFTQLLEEYLHAIHNNDEEMLSKLL